MTIADDERESARQLRAQRENSRTNLTLADDLASK
jgi:hypothetical protein